MPDFQVTFKGDLGNLAAFNAAVRNSSSETVRLLDQANKKVAASAGKISGTLRPDSGAGLFTTKQKTQIDAFNRTFVQSGQIVRRFVSEYQVLKDETGSYQIKPIFSDAYLSSFNKAIGNLDAYEKAIKKTAKTEAQIDASNLQTAQRKVAALTKVQSLEARRAANLGQIKDIEENAVIASQRRAVQQDIALAQSGRGYLLPGSERIEDLSAVRSRIDQLKNQQNRVGGLKSPQELASDAALARQLENDINTPASQRLSSYLSLQQQKLAELDNAIRQATAGIRANVAQDTADIDKAVAEVERIEKAGQRRAARLRNANPAYAEARRAANDTPPIDRNLAQVLRESQEVSKQLLRAGLGGGAVTGSEQFKKNLASQEAAVSNYTENLRTGVKTVQGSFRDLNTGLLKQFSVDLDENGKVVGRWGGQLRGAGNFLRQTVRDFQKVIEWTVATTLVFGALATVVGQLSSINELNTFLTRFSITAQTSAEETQNLFRGLAEVAYDTATPLKEIVKVADDIALATRDANQSTAEWQKSIIDLTQAVGIFTNLTGKDTVQSADLLSAAFKQLDIAPDQLVGVLSKVTAVAGGQSTAIADIVQALGGVSEAAQAAGLTLDEQIASVQVLAQVTNKSSDEIATSFKNLFGSISSVGSVKILEKFGIDVRDETGGIRDFLDIYGDIKEALEKGIIPQNRLPDVLRGISGGPRRAPDAAALLANYDKIGEVISKSSGATNEALLANAKVLDTNQAKIIQFQNSFDTAVFEKFGAAIESLTEALTSFGIEFLGVFNEIPTALITTVLQLALFAGGLRLVGGVLRNTTGGWTGFIKGIRGAVDALKGYTVASDRAIQRTVQNGKELYRVQKGMSTVIDGRTYKGGQLVPQAYGQQNLGRGITDRRLPNIPVTPVPSFGGRISPRFQTSIGTGISRTAVGGAALVGLGAGAAALGKGIKEGFDPQLLGSVLQTGGALLTLLPGLGTAAGLAAIGVGTALQFIGGEADKTKKSAAELSAEIYTLTQTLQATQEEANNYANAQKKAAEAIKEIQGKEKQTANDRQLLAQATTEYVTATLALSTANKQVSDTFQEIIDKIPNLADKYSSFKSLISSGGLRPDDPVLKSLQQQLAGDILRQSGQGVFAGSPIPLASSVRGAQTGGGTIVQLESGKEFDLNSLVKSPEDLRKLFGLDQDPLGQALGVTPTSRAVVPANEQSFRLIQGALAQVIKEFNEGSEAFSEDDINILIQAVSSLAESASSFSQNTAAIAQQRAGIQSQIATGQLRGQAGTNALQANSLAQILNDSIGRYQPPARSPDERGTPDPQLASSQGTLSQLFDTANKGIVLQLSLLRETAIQVLKLDGSYYALAGTSEQALNEGILELLKAAGVEQQLLDQYAKAYNSTLLETKSISDELAAGLESAKATAREQFADRSLQLQVAENSGDFEKNAKGLAILKDQNQQAYDSTIKLIDGIGVLSDTSFVNLNNALSQVIGLQGVYISDTQAASLTAEDLALRQSELSGKLIDSALAAGVNAEGIKKITQQVGILIGAIAAIPPYKEVLVVLKTNIQNAGMFGAGPSSISTAAQQIKDLEKKSKSADNAAQKAINDAIARINKIFKSGGGSNLGQLPSSSSPAAKAAKPYDPPGLLDIPEEVLQQSNYRELIDKAVQNAKNLQSIVPGASKANKGEIVELLNGTKRVLEVRGVGEEFLRRAMEELTGQIKRQNDLLAKADTIRRIRVGAGDFAALANVPVNSKSGVSVGGENAVNISLNLNGTVLTPAQFAQFANLVAAALKRQLAA